MNGNILQYVDCPFYSSLSLSLSLSLSSTDSRVLSELELELCDRGRRAQPVEIDLRLWPDFSPLCLLVCSGQSQAGDIVNVVLLKSQKVDLWRRAQMNKASADCAFRRGLYSQAASMYAQLTEDEDASTAVDKAVLLMNCSVAHLRCAAEEGDKHAKLRALAAAEDAAQRALRLLLSVRAAAADGSSSSSDNNIAVTQCTPQRVARAHYLVGQAILESCEVGAAEASKKGSDVADGGGEHAPKRSELAVGAMRAALQERPEQPELVRGLERALEFKTAAGIGHAFAGLIAAAQAPHPLSRRDGLALRPVDEEIRLSSEQTVDLLTRFFQGREDEGRELLLRGWRHGRFPLKSLRFVLAGLRSVAYCRAAVAEGSPLRDSSTLAQARAEQALRDAKAAVAFSPEMPPPSQRTVADNSVSEQPSDLPIADKERRRLRVGQLIDKYAIAASPAEDDGDATPGSCTQLTPHLAQSRAHLALVTRAEGGGGLLDQCVDAPHLAIVSAGTGATAGCVNMVRRTWARAYFVLGEAHAALAALAALAVEESASEAAATVSAAIAFQRALEAEPWRAEYAQRLAVAAALLPPRYAAILTRPGCAISGADALQVALAEHKLMTAPEYLRPKERWHYYTQWTRQRILELEPGLPESVVTKLLQGMDAGELDLHLHHPAALRSKVHHCLAALDDGGEAALAQLPLPKLTWKELKALKASSHEALPQGSGDRPAVPALCAN